MTHKNESRFTLGGAVKHGRREEMGQVKSQTLLTKSLHAGPRSGTLERVRKSRSGLETHTHIPLCEERKSYLMEMR